MISQAKETDSREVVMRRLFFVLIVLLLILLPGAAVGQPLDEERPAATAASQERFVVFEAFSRDT